MFSPPLNAPTSLALRITFPTSPLTLNTGTFGISAVVMYPTLLESSDILSPGCSAVSASKPCAALAAPTSI